MDASILLPPTGTPLTGIEFNKRLPCGEVERARRVSLTCCPFVVLVLDCLHLNMNDQLFPRLYRSVCDRPGPKYPKTGFCCIVAHVVPKYVIPSTAAPVLQS